MTVASEQRTLAPPAFLTRSAGLGHRCLSLPHSGLEKGRGGNGVSGACTPTLALLDEWSVAADRAVWILYLVDKVKFKTIREADSNLLIF